jgi:hypothetical protein
VDHRGYTIGGTQPPRDFWIDNNLSGAACQMWLDGCYAGSATSDAQTAQSLCATASAILYTRNAVNASTTTSGAITPY